MTPPQRRRRHHVPHPAPEAVVPPDEITPPEPITSPEPREEGERKPERFYTITGPDGERAPLDLVTLIVARAEQPSSATPEQTAVLRLCAAPLSVAEVSAYLRLPFSVVSVLLTEMLAAELVHARAPIVRQKLPDRSLLEAVMHGLQRL
ncbi:DUF742 domain-containing protein [Streptomyces sp. NPDC001388]|uniref:DUF742 domain-containing protein n=1 Tax=unclassified Streptomyces TaxID=2593676 RepID=UPI00368CCD16